MPSSAAFVSSMSSRIYETICDHDSSSCFTAILIARIVKSDWSFMYVIYIYSPVEFLEWHMMHMSHSLLSRRWPTEMIEMFDPINAAAVWAF